MFRVVWSSTAAKNYRDNLVYLDKFWSKKEIVKFIDAVDIAIANISSNPYMGSVSDINHNYRKYLVVEQIYLYYRVTGKNDILIASFWNNFQDPNKLDELLS